MKTSIANLEDELFGMRIDHLLGSFEYAVQVKANAAVELMLERIDAMVATGNVITDADLERATGPVNDLLKTEIGQAMVDTQAALRDLAAERGGVTAVAPFFTAGTLLRQAEMDDVLMAEWFERRSPSKWMKGLMAEVRKGIEAGWDRHRSVTGQTSKRIAAIAIETGLWSHANRTMVANWTAREFRHVTRQDELVCDRCGPLNGNIFSGASNGPPVHPRCRCIAVPVPAG